jgi:hypothetical protein
VLAGIAHDAAVKHVQRQISITCANTNLPRFIPTSRARLARRMARYRDDGEVQIDNSTKVHFRNAFQQLIIIAALNVGTLLRGVL